MIDTAPTGFFLFVGLMIAAAVWIFSVPTPEATPPAPPAGPPPETPGSTGTPADTSPPPSATPSS